MASLELLAGRLALDRFTPADIAELKAVNGRLAEARDRGDVSAMLELNHAFHRLISERGGNRRLALLLDDLRSQLTRLELWYYSHRERTQRSIQEHEEIIAAIERGDRPRALPPRAEHVPHLPQPGGRGRGGALGRALLRVRVAQLDHARLGPSSPQVQHLHQHRERHREVDVSLRDVLVEASAIRVTPIRSRKLSASILTVGCRSTKSLIGWRRAS